MFILIKSSQSGSHGQGVTSEKAVSVEEVAVSDTQQTEEAAAPCKKSRFCDCVLMSFRLAAILHKYN